MSSTNTNSAAAPLRQLPVLLFRQLRPKQWTKNLLIFAAPLFSFETINPGSLLDTLIGFLLLSFVSGCVYIVNDYADREADRNHPVKKYRPMASGALPPKLALVFGALLLAASLAVSYVLNPLFTGLLLLYFAMNVAYSFRLKHVVIIDIMIIAAGFVLRAIAGGLVIHVPFTPWFLLCTMLLSLFLAIGKRRHELHLLQNDKGSHRKVLDQYSFDLLDQMSSIVTTATIISYSLFTFTSGRTVHLMWTIPLVIYGMFRYLYLIHIEKKGGAPDRVLLEDTHILVTVILYVISVVGILVYFE
ncbi:decaprenyl-phosphate phosphoribosyltransferase [Paenibacillus glucanolyticus]|uniref:Phosphoribose diphosphate--decaprenyl-phosphate phosphoribosyltransferase n=1 Tax=Paenibacillus glucanolyticus TaxID=59843 RepID=A0A163E6P2_9BACL|nr:MULTISPECIES: decaprenyl-phosphate phosphoribosyltransferase [Paenibacillus]ANA83065.1 phosphoribose diphosphate--decaprenyl-phosphate phosphoribosyltransferase [Paenibacillus glucanolyticus]AVV57845.1 decaprenyl-phosphate phosphoribosyltransferase [Paenibacillus glucanolyticus]AWP27006.1 decaprenyl-phosphate phosphoribosyltransferase [Paenibacillus sp. Cedars]ETT34628.1 UbiA prenyltransferase [Paenibacillus sp. FSL R5-808]KZS43642.1 phosphoribose diphosphate--decaprenyl-phosphate phosphori